MAENLIVQGDTLGDIILKYRQQNNMSERDFAQKSGLSRSYVGFIERNVNPSTGKPVSPSLQTIAAVAKAIECDPAEILNAIGISVSAGALSADANRSLHQPDNALPEPTAADAITPFKYIPVTVDNLKSALSENRVLILPFPAPREQAFAYVPSLKYGMVITVQIKKVLGGVFYVSSMVSEVFGEQRFTIFDIGTKIFMSRNECADALSTMLSENKGKRQDDFYV